MSRIVNKQNALEKNKKTNKRAAETARIVAKIDDK